MQSSPFQRLAIIPLPRTEEPESEIYRRHIVIYVSKHRSYSNWLGTSTSPPRPPSRLILTPASPCVLYARRRCSLEQRDHCQHRHCVSVTSENIADAPSSALTTSTVVARCRASRVPNRYRTTAIPEKKVSAVRTQLRKKSSIRENPCADVHVQVLQIPVHYSPLFPPNSRQTAPASRLLRSVIAVAIYAQGWRQIASI